MCWIEAQHLRDIADLLTKRDFEAVLSEPAENRSWQLKVSGGWRVPDWQQEECWIVRCRPTADDTGAWLYHYDSGELIGDTNDKLLVVYRLEARIHDIDEVVMAPAQG